MRLRGVSGHQPELPAQGTGAHREKPLASTKNNGARSNILDHMRSWHHEFAHQFQAVPLEPDHPRGLNSITEHTVPIALAVGPGQQHHMPAVTAAIQVNLQRPRVRQHGLG